MTLSVYPKTSQDTVIRIAIAFIAMVVTIRGNASEDRAATYRELIRNLRWILVTVENLDAKIENPRKLTEQIRNDVQTRLGPFSLRVRMAEKAEQIPAESYLWVRVHKIELERTVYLSSIELVVKGNNDPKNDSSQTEKPPRYTSVSNQLYTVRQKVGYLLNDLVRDYLR